MFVTILGCALRIAGAQGDLWLDEVHSLMLIQSIHRPDEVFWNINHDNNHFLTTLYLFAVGPHHSPVVLRLESIVLGTLSIPAAGLAAFKHRHRDVVAAAAAMLLCAILYPAVHYGSEARGYAGLTLFSLLAIYVIEGGLGTAKRQMLLGVIVLAGVFSQMLMGLFVCGLMVWRLALTWQPKEDIFVAGYAIVRQFWAAVASICLIVACMKIGSLHHDFVRGTGAETPPPGQVLRETGHFFDYALGLPQATVAGFVCSAGLLAFQLKRSNRSNYERNLLYVTAVPGYILWHVVVGRHGLLAPRYSMPMLAPLVLLLADCVSRGMRADRGVRKLTILCCLSLCIGTVLELAKFYADGRGDYANAVVTMTQNGSASFTSDVTYGHSQVVAYYAEKLGVTATYIPARDTCAVTPDWLLKGRLEPMIRQKVTFGPARCVHIYEHPQVFTYWGLAGWNWILYRRTS